VLVMIIKHPSSIWKMVSANELSAIDHSPWKEQLLSKRLKEMNCARMDR